MSVPIKAKNHVHKDSLAASNTYTMPKTTAKSSHIGIAEKASIMLCGDKDILKDALSVISYKF